MRAVRLIQAFLLVLLVQLAGTQGQGPPDVPVTQEIMNFSAEIEGSFQLVSIGPSKDIPQDASIEIRVADISREPRTQVADPVFHYFSMEAYFRDHASPAGWALAVPGFDASPVESGQTKSTFVLVQHLPSAEVGAVDGFINITMRRREPPAEISKVYNWAVQFVPTPVASIRISAGAPMNAGPNEYIEIPATITNLDFYPAAYVVAAKILESEGVTPADLTVVGVGSYYLQSGETRRVTIGLQTPREKTWYTGSQLVIILTVRPNAGEGPTQSTTHVMNLEGFYINENLILVVTAFLLQLALLILAIGWFLRWRDENVYGKPIPPWKIPQEKENLERLKYDDPRAHYVLRYFLMEEEYRSALMWYHSFKRVSKKQLKAEAKVVALRERAAELEAPDLEAFDRRGARLNRRYEHKKARLQAGMEKRLAALQERLNRSFERDYEKDHEKWETQVEKLERRANKPFLKEQKRWAQERDRLVAEWEKPFLKEKKRYEKKLRAAKERYATLVKKKDKAVHKAWREQMEDWRIENSVRKREGQASAPEPELLSAAVAREGFPEALQFPPKPQIPPEPTRVQATDLPAEPRLIKPSLDQSHYARKANRIRRRTERLLKRFDGELVIALEHVARLRTRAERRASRERRVALEASGAAAGPSLVDRAFRRTPEAQERRHRRAFIRGQTKERIRELREVEEAGVERSRIEAQRKEAELEAKIIRGRAEVRKRARLGSAGPQPAFDDVGVLERKLEDQVAQDRAAVLRAETEAGKRVGEGIRALKAQEEAQLIQVESEVAAQASRKEKRPVKT